MADEEEFLRAIRRDPDDDTLRLVFADLLEEQGDPRAELIRAQLELADHRNSGDEALKARERELVETLADNCVRDLSGFGVKSVEFSRGLVDSVTAQGDRFPEGLRTLNRWGPAVRRLQWRGLPRAADAVLQRVLQSPFLATLLHLDLGGNQMGRRGLKTLAASRRLSQLQTLNLSGNQLGGQGIQDLLAAKELKLTVLELASNNLAAFDVAALAEWPGCRTIHTLDLSDNHMSDEGLRRLSRGRRLGALRHLDIGRNDIGADGIMALADSPNLTDLEWLSLSGNELGSTGMQWLTSASNFGRLRALSLSHCGLNGNSIKSLAASPYLVRLSSLSLAGNNIREELRHLPSAEFSSQLTRLDLRNTNMDRYSVQELIDQTCWRPDLQLDLRDNQLIPSRSWRALRERFGPRIRHDETIGLRAS